MKDNEIDRDLDGFITDLATLVGEEQKGAFVRVPDRVKLVEMTAKEIEKAVDGAEIVCRLHDPFESFGSVGLRGKEITVRDPKLFVKLARMADNIDACPMLDGTVDVGFAYSGLSRKVD